MKPSLTLLMMTTVIALTSCEIVKIEPEYYFLMNWGYDGMWNNGLYTRGSYDNWTVGNINFKYDVSIYYNIQ